MKSAVKEKTRNRLIMLIVLAVPVVIFVASVIYYGLRHEPGN